MYWATCNAVTKIQDDEHVFVEHHLPGAPQRLGDLHGLSGIAAVDRNDGDVMRRSGLGHRHVADFGLQGHAYRRQEYPLRCLRDTGVLLRRNPHDRGRVYRIPPPREGRDVEKRITVFERIEPRMVAEGAFDGFLLRRVDITLDHEVAVGRDINIVGDALHEFHGTAAQEPGQQVFVHVVGHRSRRGVGIDGIAAQRDRNGHPAAQTLVGVVMARSGLVNMPVHTRRTVVEDLHAVHADVAHARFGIDRIDHRLGESDQKMLLARAIQMFMPGKPQIWYLDLFAGKNDHEAVQRAGESGHKEINRTNLSGDQIAEGLKKDVVQKQLALIRMRNTHKAFSEGAEVTISGEESSLEIRWEYDGAYAELHVNFEEGTYTIESN